MTHTALWDVETIGKTTENLFLSDDCLAKGVFVMFRADFFSHGMTFCRESLPGFALPDPDRSFSR